MASTKPKVVDIHTHMYPPSYIDILTSRTAIPVVRTFPQAADPRLILLDAEQQALDAALQDPTAKPPGRPLTSHYASLDQKIHFMDTHSIDISVVSLANPWLDFIEPKEAAATARSVNDEFEAICILHDGQLVAEGKVGAARRTIWDVLREQVYLDAVIYSEIGLKAAIAASGGADRLMFGTDHPFFPPLGTDEQSTWESVTWNAEAVSKAVGKGSEEADGIMGGNAIRLLRLETV
ncbi:Homocitrate synthase [Verticillium dahliae VDG1]|nr:Homocitrate synthase [Verticillium dahliae VDG1]